MGKHILSFPKGKSQEQAAREAAGQLLSTIRNAIVPITELLASFAGAKANKREISLELTFLAIHAYDRLCHEYLPPNMKCAFVDALVYAFAESHSKTFIDEQQSEFREYFLKKLDERQTYYGEAESLYGHDDHSVIRKFAEMMSSFFPNMNVLATTDVAEKLCLGIKESLVGPVPTPAKNQTARYC